MYRKRTTEPKSVICPRCKGVALPHPNQCSGCEGRGFISIAYYVALRTAQREAHAVLVARGDGR